MKPYRNLLIALGIVLAMCSSAFAQEREIETNGEAAPGANQTPIEVRELAITDALRNAVEIGVGVFLTSQTQTKNFELLEDKIFKQSKGFARVKEIISEGATPSGAYRVRIKAVVSSQKLVTSLRQVIRGFNDPRIGVYLKETLDGKPAPGQAGSVALAKALVNLGFRVLDPQQLEAKLSRDKLIASLENPQALRQAQTTLGVDLIVTGTVRGTRITNPPKEVTDSGNLSISTVLETKLIDIKTAQIVWTDQYTDAEIGLAIDETASRAARNTAALSLNDLIERLLQYVQQGSDAAPSVYLVKVSGFKSYGAFNAFVQKLSTQTGVSNVQARDFGKISEIEVEFKGTVQGLAQLLDKLGLEITAVTGGEIRANAK
jgi:hypothetical protein